jgi:hypothetical protein
MDLKNIKKDMYLRVVGKEIGMSLELFIEKNAGSNIARVSSITGDEIYLEYSIKNGISTGRFSPSELEEPTENDIALAKYMTNVTGQD